MPIKIAGIKSLLQQSGVKVQTIDFKHKIL